MLGKCGWLGVFAIVASCANEPSTPLQTTGPGLAGVVVDQDGKAIEGALVTIEGLASRDWPRPSDPVRSTFTGSGIDPSYVVVRLGQPWMIENRSGEAHSIHVKSRRNGDWNINVGDGETVPARQLPLHEEIGFATIRCDVHTELQAAVAFLDHPFFVVTGPDGRFSFAGLPVAQGQVRAHHPRAGRGQLDFGSSEPGPLLLKLAR